MYYLNYFRNVYFCANFYEFSFQTFGFSISYIKNDHKQFLIVNNIDEIETKEFSSSEESKYQILLKPILGALIMLRAPISEGFYKFNFLITTFLHT